MASWSNKIEEEITNLLKEWLKQQGRTQADLRTELQAVSTRMPAILEVLKQDFEKGGIPKVADHLCSIENTWSKETRNLGDSNNTNTEGPIQNLDPFGQLDLILDEIREDCETN